MIQDVFHLVLLAPLNQHQLTKCVANRLGNGFAAIHNEQKSLTCVHSPADQVSKQTLADFGVLRRPFPEPQNVFLTIPVNAQGDDDGVLAQEDGINKDNQ